MSRRSGTSAAAVALLAAAWAIGLAGGENGPGPAAAQGSGSAPCGLGGTTPTMDSPAPFAPPALVSNENFDCMAWQAFISLNWPALAGQQGVPDPSKALGTPGPTVWQTFATVDQVFLANGARPALLATPGGAAKSAMAAASPRLAVAGVAGPRRLSQKSKVSRAFVRTRAAAPASAAHALVKRRSTSSPTGVPLDSNQQVGGSVLVDQNGKFVYYEELLSPTEVAYIVGNGLYEAGAQNRFAAKTAIALPPGSVELKAAWKILGPGDVPGHYITAQAYIDGGSVPTTVGLVGLHMMIRVAQSAGLNQGVWATFSQIENAPVSGSAPLARYAFNNPSCPQTACPINVETAAPTPTQVSQIFPVDSDAAPVNAYVAGLVSTHPAAGAMAYYRLLNVQWPRSSTPLPRAPQSVLPLPSGTPNTPTLINPVLETFLQNSGMSCLGCHAGATTAPPPKNAQGPCTPGPFASGFSFLLSHAQAAPCASGARRK